MICEELLGNLKDEKNNNIEVDYVDIEWHEAFKKIHKKFTHSGTELGIRLGNDILSRGLRDGDILYKDNSRIIAVNIPKTEVIKIDIDKNHSFMLGKVCYEIGNKHATLFWGENHLQVITPYNEPLFIMIKKLHGVYSEVKKMKLDFDKSISKSINNHSH